jgi:hypothetical protein
MEEDKQHGMQAAMDRPMHTMSNPSAHDTPQEHVVMPVSGEMTAPFILLVQGRV